MMARVRIHKHIHFVTLILWC